MRRRLATIPCLIALLTPIAATSQESIVYPSSFCIGCAAASMRASATPTPDVNPQASVEKTSVKFNPASAAPEPPEPLFNRAAIFALILSGERNRVGP